MFDLRRIAHALSSLLPVRQPRLRAAAGAASLLALLPAASVAQEPDEAPVSEQLRGVFTEALESSPAAWSRTALDRGTVLLEAGSVLHDRAVLEQDGSSAAPALDRLAFAGAYGDLVRSRIGATRSERFPSVTELFARGSELRQASGVVPLAIAAVDYSTYADRLDELSFDDRGRVSLPQAPPDERTFVGVAALANILPAWNPTLVVSSELVAGRDPAQIRELAVRLDRGRWRPARFDRPFAIGSLFERRRLDDGDSVTVELRFEIDGRRVRARTRLTWRETARATVPGSITPVAPGPGGIDAGVGDVVRQIAPPDPDCPVLCYDMPQVTAGIDFPPGQFGRINPRIYPSTGQVVLVDGERVPRLRRVIVAVDGFDAFNTRTHDDLWADFQRGFLEFLEWGFDIVVVDYDVGNDWIQKNGYAVRELITEVVPEWIDPAWQNEPLIVIGGSMGTQTTRWALRTAELGYPDGIAVDHDVDLWLAIDGPFKGATIPIGLQAIADFLKDEAAEGELFEQALNSPAARQLMPRTRLVGADLPKKKDYDRGNPLEEWYVPDPQHTAYYGFVDQPWFGLPRLPRTGAVASGSGTGTFLIPGPQPGWLPTSMFNRVFKDNILARVNIWAQTDHDYGHIFHGHLRKFLSWRTRDLFLGPADWLDVSPADLRFTPLEIAGAWNGQDDPFGTMEVHLPVHSFTPTTSALYTQADSQYYYYPGKDPDAADRIPFDSFHWEKCNLPHVAISNGQLAYAKREIFALFDGSMPEHPELYTEECGVPEPVDRCLGYVDWFERPNRPTDIFPWYDGANCYVAPVPAGETGFVADNAYWVERRAGKCQVGIPDSTGGRLACYLGDAPSDTSAFVWHGSFYYDGYD